MEYLKPKYFLIGVFLGFVSCCLLGFKLSKSAKFDNYVRMYHSISIANQYFPTVNELINTAESKIGPNKIIVIVGGSSIFRGAGQNADEVWTLELQKLLGDKYTVLNFAVDGGGLNTYGSVIYRILKERYAKVIYVSTCVLHSPEIDGGERYNHLFWDAYYKNFLHIEPDETDQVKNLRIRQLLTSDGFEIQVLAFLNSYTYFRDLWNWISYHIVSGVIRYSPNTNVLVALKKNADPHLDYLQLQKYKGKDVVRLLSDAARFEKGIPDFANLKKTADLFNDSFQSAFVSTLRVKTLCVFVNENPQILGLYSPTALKTHDHLQEKANSIVRSLGYNTLIVGREYAISDYVDGRHLVAKGGNKVARDIYSNVVHIAKKNNYLKS